MRESISTPILLLVSQSIFGSLYNTMPYVETWLSAFAALPPGLEIVWVCTHGATHWYILAKIDAIVGGTPRSFFLKNVVTPMQRMWSRQSTSLQRLYTPQLLSTYPDLIRTALSTQI
jgi:hypothetical protein